jgi:exodeoxyribonuclease-5
MHKNKGPIMNAPAELSFNPEQQEGIQRIVAWFKGWQDRKHRKQIFALAGRAGTGKTSLAQAAATSCTSEYRVVFIAPTGKAASRLRQKGCKGAKTLHQFVYNVRGEDEDGDPIFVEKGFNKETPLLIVLDEGSMVGEYDMKALLRFNIPVLVLCDLGQLQPVKAPPSLTPEHIDFELTQIMRQAAESNIIRAAGFVRDGKRLPLREYPDVRVRAGNPPLDELIAHSGIDSQILCSYNNTRVAVNRKIREALGFTGDTPNVGEKVMCWFNQHAHNFMNGEQGIVLGFDTLRDDELNEDEPDELQIMRLKSLTDGRERRVKFNPLSFHRDPEVSGPALKGVGGFQFGWCCTIHKSQGSEWDNVLVFEEMMGDYAKMQYTAYTRAAKVLTVYRG